MENGWTYNSYIMIQGQTCIEIMDNFMILVYEKVNIK
jgi:hypothetical protein